MLYPNPGFPNYYSSLVEFLGGVAVPYTYVEHADGFRLVLEALERSIPARTRLLILNDFHNPTGAECSPRRDLAKRLAELVLEHDLFVLCDEAYFADPLLGRESFARLAATHVADRAVILYTFGKKYAMTGFRLGAAIGPRPVIDIIVRLNVNWESCSNHFAQYGAVEALIGDQSGRLRMLEALRERRDAGARRS